MYRGLAAEYIVLCTLAHISCSYFSLKLNCNCPSDCLLYTPFLDFNLNRQ